MSPSSLTRVFLTCCLLTTTLYSEMRITSKTITPTPTQTTIIINTFRGSVMLFTHANINHVTDMLSMFHKASDGSLPEKVSAQFKEINNRLSNNAKTDIIVVEIVTGKPADIKKAITRYDLLTNGIAVLAQHPAKDSINIDISYMVILPATVYSGAAIIIIRYNITVQMEKLSLHRHLLIYYLDLVTISPSLSTLICMTES